MKLSESILSASLRLCTLLLLIYPRSFRREYGELMIQLFCYPIGDGMRQRGCLGAIPYGIAALHEVWWRVVAQMPATAWQQHFLAWGKRRKKRRK